MEVIKIFENCYDETYFGNPSDPFNDLIYIILSNKTNPKVAQKIYYSIKSRFKNLDDLGSIPI